MKQFFLNGTWRFQLDPQNRGKEEKWYQSQLKEKIELPGTTDDAGVGIPVTEHTLRNLSRRNMYMGVAWYQKEIDISEKDACCETELFLERCLWESTAWLDGKKIGSQDSLAAPHTYHLGMLSPGKHCITIAVDNSNLRDGVTFEDDVLPQVQNQDLKTTIRSYRKLNCGGHHTMFLMDTNWNGIIGEISLRLHKPLEIQSINLYVKNDLKSADISFVLYNPEKLETAMAFQYYLQDTEGNNLLVGVENIHLTGVVKQQHSFSMLLSDEMEPWSEHSPVLYDLKLRMDAPDAPEESKVRFGLRYVRTKGRHILLNSHPVYLRGTIEDCTFPLTFAPPMDKESWERIFRIAKSYGLNHLRFHTFCPPEAAFEAADCTGFYLQVELPGTSCPDTDEEPEVTEYLQKELERILEYYGNHPSFLLLSMGNEQLVEVDKPKILQRHQKMLMEKVEFSRKKDPRHLYICTSHPYTDGRDDDVYVSSWSQTGWEIVKEFGIGAIKKLHAECENTGLRCHIWGGGPNPLDTMLYCMKPPTLDRDFDAGMQRVERPFISHEVGQWAVFPNVNEISKYTGVLYPGNLEIIRSRMEETGVLPLASRFVEASGQLALLLYKDEIETLLKSNTISGFQLLDLIDYPGQGTSTVGILDAFWESKGLISPEEFRQFCGPMVLLARMQKRIWLEGEAVSVSAFLANYSGTSYQKAVHWLFKDENGHAEASGVLEVCELPDGSRTPAGHFVFVPERLSKPRRLTLELSIPSLHLCNTWHLWVYPQTSTRNIKIETQWNASVKKKLEQGEKILLCPKPEKNCVPGVFTTTFWNPNMKKQVGTYGILCDEKHPVFRDFPTSFYTDWQWWDVISYGWSLDLGTIPLDPIVRVIDSFTTNRHLGMMWEVKVGRGSLLVCCTSFQERMEYRPATAQLLSSIADYMESNEFHPAVSVSFEELDRLFT